MRTSSLLAYSRGETGHMVDWAEDGCSRAAWRRWRLRWPTMSMQ